MTPAPPADSGAQAAWSPSSQQHALQQVGWGACGGRGGGRGGLLVDDTSTTSRQWGKGGMVTKLTAARIATGGGEVGLGVGVGVGHAPLCIHYISRHHALASLCVNQGFAISSAELGPERA
jgi:hypothetical protein